MIKKFVALPRRSDTAADVENMRAVIEGPFRGDMPIDPDSKAPRADVYTFKLEASRDCDKVGFYRTPGISARCRVGSVDSFESFRSRVAELLRPIDVETLRIQCVEHKEVSEESFLTLRDLYDGLSFTRKRPYQNRLESATPRNVAPKPEPKPKPERLPTLRRPQAIGQATELAAAHLLASCMEPPVAERLQAQVAELQTELRQHKTEEMERLRRLEARLEGRFTELEARILALPQEERITAPQQGSAHQSPRS